MHQNSFSAGALPRTPLGSSRSSPRPPSWLRRGTLPPIPFPSASRSRRPYGTKILRPLQTKFLATPMCSGWRLKAWNIINLDSALSPLSPLLFSPSLSVPSWIIGHRGYSLLEKRKTTLITNIQQWVKNIYCSEECLTAVDERSLGCPLHCHTRKSVAKAKKADRTACEVWYSWRTEPDAVAAPLR